VVKERAQLHFFRSSRPLWQCYGKNLTFFFRFCPIKKTYNFDNILIDFTTFYNLLYPHKTILKRTDQLFHSPSTILYQRLIYS